MGNEKEIFQQTRDLIISDFELEARDDLQSEEALLDYLANVIAHYIDKNKLEYLFQILYRLDVDENKMKESLSADNPEPANITLARHILEREKKRILTKLEYKPKAQRDWFEFEEE